MMTFQKPRLLPDQNSFSVTNIYKLKFKQTQSSTPLVLMGKNQNGFHHFNNFIGLHRNIGKKITSLDWRRE